MCLSSAPTAIYTYRPPLSLLYHLPSSPLHPRPGRAVPSGHVRRPLLALGVWTDDERRRHLTGDPVTDRRRRAQGHTGDVVELGQGATPMEMRVDRHQPVDAGRHQPREGARGHRLAGPAPSVLTHLAEVGCPDCDFRGPKVP